MMARTVSGVLPCLLAHATFFDQLGHCNARPPQTHELTARATDDNPQTGSSASSTAALAPGTVVNSYQLVERVQSLPSTLHALTPSHTTGGTAVHDDAFALDDPHSWIQHELLRLAENETTAAAGAARPSLDAPPANASSAPLALPSPYEELLAAATSSYRLHRRVSARHGEVWRAVRADDPSSTPLILKRLKLEASAILLAGLRERHFGGRLRGARRIARFLDAFE